MDYEVMHIMLPMDKLPSFVYYDGGLVMTTIIGWFVENLEDVFAYIVSTVSE